MFDIMYKLSIGIFHGGYFGADAVLQNTICFVGKLQNSHFYELHFNNIWAISRKHVDFVDLLTRLCYFDRVQYKER